MSNYIIMTDSCCDLSAQMAQELELNVLPLTVTIDDKSYANYLDGREISHKEFYQQLRDGKMPTTSALSVGQCEDAMRAVLQGGKDLVIIAFSSALSTTYQSFHIAATELREEFPDRYISVVDSLSASLGQGMLVYQAAQKRAEGMSAQDLTAWLEENKLTFCHWFTVDDLNHLKRGGRVSATTALVGTMLSIKPVMHVSNEGRLVPVSKARGRKAAITALLDAIEASGTNPAEQTMFICHADCEEEAQSVAQQIQTRFGTKTIHINFIGPVIGSHTGTKTIGVFFNGKER